MQPKQSILVLGAGIVGVSCALALQARGFRVAVVDRRAPGEETSHGNAGVIARSSLIPFNHGRLLRTLFSLLRNQSPGFRYSPSYLRRNWTWGAAFLGNARTAKVAATTRALNALISLSMAEHARLRVEAGVAHRYRDDGWLYGYRTEAAFAQSEWQRAVWRSFGLAIEAMRADDLRMLEPALKPVFARAVWVRDAWSVNEPGEVVKAFARLFNARGGVLHYAEVPTAQFQAQRWNTDIGAFDHLVVALGPWSAQFLQTLGLRVPMAFERGYHQQYSLLGDFPLRRPFYDVAGGYVAAPMAGGVRVSTGVELNALDAPPSDSQVRLTAQAARQALPLGEPQLQQAWCGARPTLPDSRPVIGASSQRQQLWLAFGHQHIGFSTGPGTGALLAALVAGADPPIDSTPFAPARFLL